MLPGHPRAMLTSERRRPAGARLGLASLGRGPLLLIVATAILPRLPHIWAPIVGWHSWRQADTAAIARNFHVGGMNLLYPAVDWSGAGPGFVESEFPLFPFLVAGLYRLFGPDVVWGRILAIVFATGAALYLARLCSRYLDRWAAAYAAAAFSLLPISSYIGVAFMPESLMLLASVAAVDHLDLWSTTGRERDRWASAAWLALAIAVKLPELFLGVPIAYLMGRRLGWRMVATPAVWLYAAVALIPPALWYAHAHRLGEMTGLSFGIWEAGSDKWGNLDLLTSGSFYVKLLIGRLIERHLAYAGAALLAIGLILSRSRRDLGTFKWWIAGGALYLLVVAKGNSVHDYYQLPILAPMSLWIGVAIAQALRRAEATPMRIAGRILALAFAALCLARVPHFLGKEIAGASLVEHARIVRSVVPPETLVIVVDNGDPTFLYHIDRRGWHAGAATLTPEWIEARRREGAAYIVSLAGRPGDREARSALERLQSLGANRSPTSDLLVLDLKSP